MLYIKTPIDIAMNKTKYVLPTFAAVFALMFAAATPYVIAESGDKAWSGETHTKNVRQDMAEKLNRYCEMTAEDKTALIEKYNKPEEMVTKMNEYCVMDDSERQAFVDQHQDQYKMHHNDMMKKPKHHMMLKVDGFTGKITLPDLSEIEDKKAIHEEIKSQVTVKLSEAAAVAENAGLDVIKGNMEIVVNEDGVKSLAWIMTSMNMNGDTEKIPATIFVVDAADATNTAQITKEFDRFMDKKTHDGKYDKTALSDPEQLQNKISKIEEKLSQGTSNIETSAAKTKFVDILKQLQTAIEDGDDEQADSLREQLKDLRNQMVDLKKFR